MNEALIVLLALVFSGCLFGIYKGEPVEVLEDGPLPDDVQ